MYGAALPSFENGVTFACADAAAWSFRRHRAALSHEAPRCVMAMRFVLAPRARGVPRMCRRRWTGSKIEGSKTPGSNGSHHAERSRDQRLTNTLGIKVAQLFFSSCHVQSLPKVAMAESSFRGSLEAVIVKGDPPTTPKCSKPWSSFLRVFGLSLDHYSKRTCFMMFCESRSSLRCMVFFVLMRPKVIFALSLFLFFASQASIVIVAKALRVLATARWDDGRESFLPWWAVRKRHTSTTFLSPKLAFEML